MASSDSAGEAAADGHSSSPAQSPRRTTGRRTSGRVRKEVQRLGATNKKHTSAGSDDEDQDLDSDDVESEDAEEDGDDDGEFKVPTSIKTGSRKRAPPGTKADGAPSKRKKTVGAGRKPSTAARRKKAAADDDDEDFEGGAASKRAAATGSAGATKPGKDFKINDDNEIFNAVKSPNSALQQVAEDWIESYKEDSGPAMAELVNFVLRCCGCNAIIDEHQAEDENGIVENLKDIVDEFKQEANMAYPLISKSKTYKKFRTSLASFLQKLLIASADDLLYSTSYYEHFKAWTHALSSSQIRALRHTATVITLSLVQALSVLRLSVDKEHAQTLRAKEAEVKKGRKDKARLRDMERQVKEAHERLQAVEDLMDESFTGVFVNRYRDADPVIRAECISAIGGWMKTDPEYWVDGNYLRYIGWVLSDESKETRREAVRAIFALYQKEAYIGKLGHFTDRFKKQLVHMACGEHDINVRIQALQVVRQIEANGLLDDDEQRDAVAMLVFEKEKRVRHAAADFFRGLVEEQVEELKSELDAHGKTARGRKVGGNKKADKERERALEQATEYKALAGLLVKYGRKLDGRGDDDELDAEDGADEDEAMADLALAYKAGDDEADPGVPRGRVAFAVEALWDSIAAVQDWEGMLAFLLKDHSPVAASSAKSSGKGKGKAANGRGKKTSQVHPDEDEEMADENVEEGEEALPQQVRLTEDEETLFVEILLAALTRVTQAQAVTKKDKEQEDEDLANVSRIIINALPQLFAKHQTFSARIVDILAIPRLISLDLYLDMQQISAYETLWDDVSKQFKKNTEADVLDQAARTLVVFLAANNLSATNSTKIADLERDLLESLRTAAGDDVENASLDEDEVATLTAVVSRIEYLYRVKSLNEALDDMAGDTGTSALEIVDNIVNRGQRGYKEEEELVGHAIRILAAHLSWHLLSVVTDVRLAGTSDLSALVALTEERRTLLEKLEEFAVGNGTNAAEGIKRIALAVVLDIYLIAQTITSAEADPNKLLEELKLTANEELQARCAGYIEAEIERHAELLAEQDDEDEEASPADQGDEEEPSSGSDTETESNQRNRKKKAKGEGKKGKGKRNAGAPAAGQFKLRSSSQLRAHNARERARLLATTRFEQTIAPFVRAIHAGAFDLSHATVVLKYWGRLGPVFDEQAKLLMHDLRDDGNYGSSSASVAGIIVDALKGACDLYIDAGDDVATEEHLVSLGRHLQGVAAVRGAQLAIVSRLPSADHLRLHVDALKWAVAKLARFEEAKRKADRDRLLSFFKALGHLLFGLDGRSALKVKTTLDALLDENEIEVPAMSKIWEPVRAYQRRLITNMSKDPSLQKAATADRAKSTRSKGKGKGKAIASDEEEEERDELDEDENPDDDDDAAEAIPAAKKRKAPAISQELYGSTGSPAKRQRTAEPEDLDNDDALDALLAENGSPAKSQSSQVPGAIEDDAQEEEVAQDAHEQQEAEEEEQQRVATPQAEPELETGELQMTEEDDEADRPNFEREDSVASEISLTDVKLARRRKIRK